MEVGRDISVILFLYHYIALLNLSPPLYLEWSHLGCLSTVGLLSCTHPNKTSGISASSFASMQKPICIVMRSRLHIRSSKPGKITSECVLFDIVMSCYLMPCDDMSQYRSRHITSRTKRSYTVIITTGSSEL